jgi:hypothetical protein
LWIGLKRLDGFEANESVIQGIRYTHKNHWGDFVLTNKSNIFLKLKSILGQGREQLHRFNFDEISCIQTKKTKTGIFRQGLVTANRTEPMNQQSYCYACEEHKSVLFLAFFERQKLLLRITKEVDTLYRKWIQ